MAPTSMLYRVITVNGFPVAFWMWLCCGVQMSVAQTPELPDMRPQADHHVHILSPRLIADWKSLGMPFSRSNEYYHDPAVILENMGVEQACIISMAHLYSSEWFERIVSAGPGEVAMVREENDYVVAAVAKFPDRLVGYYSLHPARQATIELREHYARQPGMAGWKMHLPSCGVDLGNPEQFELLKSVFAWCAAERQSILIHVFSGEEPAHLAEKFWTLVEPHPELEIILAHCGASGGYGDLPHALLSGYQSLCERKPEFSQAPIYFDISGAVLIEETEGMPPTSPENCQRLAETMRAIGLQRFLYASDYPVFSGAQVKSMLTEKLGLSVAEQSQILSNRSAALRGLK